MQVSLPRRADVVGRRGGSVIESSQFAQLRARQMPYAITYTWNLKYGINTLICKTETDAQTEQIGGCQVAEVAWELWSVGANWYV